MKTERGALSPNSIRQTGKKHLQGAVSQAYLQNEDNHIPLHSIKLVLPHLNNATLEFAKTQECKTGVSNDITSKQLQESDIYS
ncbi:hypothetical protein DSL64_03950 [Dyadobacter luteus]|uniref:Uncharacterized protein n=1 Tax=Dyadobacter luteus TaxID=2259619 RepID=A0A3D8YG03_9BACT|nr:hypothetical protein DSL64_03950 [Dyadobacter luteus]